MVDEWRTNGKGGTICAQLKRAGADIRFARAGVKLLMARFVRALSDKFGQRSGDAPLR
jgi:hypothetical protein